MSIGLTAGAVPMFAHHSFAAEYDSNKPVMLTGTVTKVEWMNPHARFYIDVTDASGKCVNWELEMGSPNVLQRQGWNRNSMKAGDQVIQGQIIGVSGATGVATGPHLHFELRFNGVPLDPLKLLAGVLPAPVGP